MSPRKTPEETMKEELHRQKKAHIQELLERENCLSITSYQYPDGSINLRFDKVGGKQGVVVEIFLDVEGARMLRKHLRRIPKKDFVSSGWNPASRARRGPQ